MLITQQFRLSSTVRPFIFMLQAGLFLSLCLWHTASSAQELENLTLVEYDIESPPFVEGQSIDGIDGWVSDFTSHPVLFTDRASDPTSVLFGDTSGAITAGSTLGAGGYFPDFTVPEEARTLTINMSGHFRSNSAGGFQSLVRLLGTDRPNFILTFGALGFTEPPIPLFVSGTDFEFERVNLSSEDQLIQPDHRSLDLTLFYDQRTGNGTVTANNLEGDRLPTIISEFTDTFLVSELGTVQSEVFFGDSNDAISAFNIQVGVVPVPEPSSFTALACLSVLALVGRRRRK